MVIRVDILNVAAFCLGAVFDNGMFISYEGEFRLVVKKDEIKLSTSQWLLNVSLIGLDLLAIRRPRRVTLTMLSGHAEHNEKSLVTPSVSNLVHSLISILGDTSTPWVIIFNECFWISMTSFMICRDRSLDSTMVSIIWVSKAKFFLLGRKFVFGTCPNRSLISQGAL